MPHTTKKHVEITLVLRFFFKRHVPIIYAFLLYPQEILAEGSGKKSNHVQFFFGISQS